MLLKNRGLAFKLILFYTLSCGVIFLAVFGFNYYFSRSIIEKKVADNTKNLVLSKVNGIDRVLKSVQKIPENLACFLENSTLSKEELLGLLRALVENNGEIYGAAIAFAPGMFTTDRHGFAPYFFKQGKRIEFADLSKEAYGYTAWDWYQIPRELNRPQWSEPYFDEGGGNILMTTYSVPFYNNIKGKRQFMGILTVDIKLEWLQEEVSAIKVLKTGYGFLISKNGTILTHPVKELVMNETIFGVAEARNDARLREIGRKMIQGETGFVPFKSLISEEPCWMYYTPVPANGWALAVLFPQREFASDITELNRLVLILGIGGLLLLSLAVAFIARSITHPLREMAQAAKAIATGDLDTVLPPVASGDEVGKLAEAFGHMQESLKEYIRQLTETTASKERIESELKIAHDIQMSILPKIFPPFPQRTEFEVYAVIEPAREVGGDFYDFFFVDEDRFCFVIGDVSGKGVPASLFMAVTKTLLKATALKGIAPGEILTEVNRELSDGNDSCMFVTLFCCILDTRTGELAYANGGHNLPIIMRRNGKAVFLKGQAGLVVGVMEDFVYETETLPLQPQEVLFLYTDGVTEAMDEEGAFFSDERLIEGLAAAAGKTVRQIIQDIMAGIHSFTRGAPQSDDITVLAIRFRGR